FTRLAALIQFAGAVYIVSAPDLQTLRARYDHSIILVLISMVYIVMALVQAWRAGNIKAKYIAAGFLITILLALHDVVIVVSGVRDAIFLFNYALPSLLFCIALVLGHDFVSTHNKIEELNTNLEKKVEHRTRELRHTLDEVRELKSQQDGDYFLTSILIQPLSGIHVSASPVSIEAIVSQKKHFEFRKWTADIGGDICAAHFITLRNKRYIAFMNGDAMGKSMQGAGGALVLGTVYKAVISRTQKSSAAQGRFPEQWLKECFLELQDVFVSFDGTMLASAVLGLVDETRGLLYYINAEHPRTVLYRSGTAAFIEQEQALRKLGIAGLEGRLSIRTQKLEVNDVILIGSDGRDDLLMGIDEEKRRIINDDDSLFLKCVEEGRGELGPIKNALLKRGEITDDFSLLRIGFQEDSGAADQDHSIHTARQLMRSRMEALLQAKDFSAASTLLIEAEQSGALDGPTAFAFTKALVKAEEYALAAQTAVRYSEAFPENTDLLFQCAMTLKVVNQLGDAADYGECLLLRDPTHVNNLANLADIYRRLGNDKRARQMITRAKTLDPTNKNVATIETLMGAATPAV
ncbi:MAG: SpoIIE family protein phosphatase, partial [Spirochaetia bacterium]|nr:SpoIIE family protein phosphatase [Spirochaetia bacterium]